MDRKLMIALLMPIAQFAVHWAENKFPGEPGSEKRSAALQYVKDQFTILERFFGNLIPTMDDSTILGLIDANVMTNNVTGEFKHQTDQRHYVDIAPDVEKRAADRSKAAPAPTLDSSIVPSHG